MLYQANRRRFLKLCLGAWLSGSLGVPLWAKEETEEKPINYTLATATTGGTYYPVGVAIATLTHIKLQAQANLRLTAISSAGSAENLKLLQENQAQFALLQAFYATPVRKNVGELTATSSPSVPLCSIANLWQNVEHFVVHKTQVKTGTLEDLRNFNQADFSIGEHGSGAEGSGRYILNALGIAPEQAFTLTHLGYGPSADALQAGRIQGANLPAGVPLSALSRVFAALGEELHLLNVTDEQLAQINSRHPLWTRYTIPAQTYPGQTQPVQTIAQPNFLAVRKDVDAEHVYWITKTLYENLDFLYGVHNATEFMQLDNALNNLTLPLHPGAMRYYQEQGITIPTALQSPDPNANNLVLNQHPSDAAHLSLEQHSKHSR